MHDFRQDLVVESPTPMPWLIGVEQNRVTGREQKQSSLTLISSTPCDTVRWTHQQIRNDLPIACSTLLEQAGKG